MQYLTNKYKIRALNLGVSFNISYMDKSKPANTKLLYLIPVFRAIQDAKTANWTLADIFDVLVIPKELKFAIISFQVFGRIEDVAESENSATVIKIIHTKSKSQLATNKLAGSLVRGFVKFSAEFNFVNFEKEGQYHFEVIHNGKRLTGANKFYFTVVKQQ